jgi:endonuclease/exonuclease/phosphatase family metal-dependent hydrolase
MSQVRILDLNIWNCNEPWPERRAKIRDLILSARPDLVALQEVRYQDWALDPRHQAEQIRAGLPGYAMVWHPAHYWPVDEGDSSGKQWEGLAILSLHPIVDQIILPLSRAKDDLRDTFQRIILAAQARTPAGAFWLFNTHYPLSGRARNRVVVESHRFVEQVAGELPFAFTGDLNARPEDLPIRYLSGQAEIAGQRGRLIDVWVERHRDEPGFTFPAWGPRQRIDYLFVPSRVQVVDISVVGAVPGREVVSPSDHCALLATLDIDA